MSVILSATSWQIAGLPSIPGISLKLTWVRDSFAAGHAFMFVGHGAERDLLAGVFERAGQRVLVQIEFGVCVFLGKAPDLPSSRDRRVVVEVHLRDEAYVFAVEAAGYNRA